LLVHATPRDPLDEYLLKDPETWAKRLQNVDADIVCVGHTHMQFKLEVNGVMVLNPGSVGLPRDGDPRAAFAVIEDGRIELRRLAYPVEETIARVEAMPWPRRAKEVTAYVLRLGRLPLNMGADGSGTAPLNDSPDA
jgi:diadenosine tetraphosphatase ApaH/serine/threonine PP2A family protein phosphatase